MDFRETGNREERMAGERQGKGCIHLPDGGRERGKGREG